MFHVSNGLFFKRLDDGSVLIIKRADSSDNSQIVFEQIIDADVWASVVATVSAYNEFMQERYQKVIFKQREKI